MKLLLALLALLTGFSVADGVRVAEPSIAEGDGALRTAWIAAEDVQISANAAVYLVVALLPVALFALPGMPWTDTPAAGRAIRTVHRSDRLRQ